MHFTSQGQALQIKPSGSGDENEDKQIQEKKKNMRGRSTRRGQKADVWRLGKKETKIYKEREKHVLVHRMSF